MEIKITEYVICQQEAFYIIKVLRNKDNIMYMQPFYKTVPALHLNIFVPNVFNKRNLPQIQHKNILCLAFNQKNAVRLSNKTVREI